MSRSDSRSSTYVETKRSTRWGTAAASARLRERDGEAAPVRPHRRARERDHLRALVDGAPAERRVLGEHEVGQLGLAAAELDAALRVGEGRHREERLDRRPAVPARGVAAADVASPRKAVVRLRPGERAAGVECGRRRGARLGGCGEGEEGGASGHPALSLARRARAACGPASYKKETLQPNE